MGQYDVAKTTNPNALEAREVLLEENHPNTLVSVSNLAVALQHQGKYKATEDINRRALERREKALEKEHPDMLNSVYCLAPLFHQQRRYKAALELYKGTSSGH